VGVLFQKEKPVLLLCYRYIFATINCMSEQFSKKRSSIIEKAKADKERKRRGRKPTPMRPELDPAASNAELMTQIEKIKQDLAAMGDLRPGSLSEQYNVCGNPACRCKADPPQKHGPYYQLSYTRKGKSGTKFIREVDVATVRQEMENYERLKLLVDTWIDLAAELSNRRLTKM
jgi:hypothetical protein